jgi:ABC-type nitrate/sulfonate/bicarbonate transport system permease component
MSVKTKLARQAVKTTAKHTAHGAASKFTRKPLRTTTALAIGAAIGGLVGWLIGRSGGDEQQFDPIAQAPAPPNVVNNNSAAEKAETGATS